MPSCMTMSHVRPRITGGAHQRVGTDLHAVEVDAVLRVGRDRHQLGERDAGGLRVDEEQRRSLGGPGEHEQPVGGLGERDVALHPVEPPAVTVGGRGQLHTLRPEAARRLEPRGRDDRIAGRDPRQPLGPLGVRPRPREHAPAHHRAHEVRRWRQRAPELGVDDDRVEHGHAAAAVLLGQRHAEQAEVGELLPELVGVPDRVVLHLAHDVEAAVPGAHPGNGLAEHLLLGREVEIHHGLQSSPWRRHGLSSGEVGTATFASDSVQITSPTRMVRSSSTQPQPAVVDRHVAHDALDHHRVAGEDRLPHLEAQAAEPSGRSGPVGDEALEPRALVRRVEEDVLHALALDREVVVVVHRTPVAGGQGTEHDGRRRDVVGEVGQHVAHRDLVDFDHATPCGTRVASVAEAGPPLDADQLGVLVAVLDVDHPEAPGAETARLFLADRHETLCARDPVAGPHRLVEGGDVLGHDRLGELEARLQVEVDLQRQLLDRAPGGPVVRAEPRRQQR